MWREGTNGADIKGSAEQTTHNSFTPTTGAKGNVLTKDHWGATPRLRTGLGVACYFRRK